MPTYKITDPETGRTLRVTGDSPPTEAELNEIFASASSPANTPEKKGLLRRSAETIVKSPALPIAGGVAGGIAGLPGVPVTGGASAMAGAGLGAAGGEAFRQIAARGLGIEAPKTSMDAAKKIGVEALTAAVGEGSGRVIGAIGKAGLKAFPRIAEAFAGSPSRNFAKALKKGAQTYFPKNARGVSRDVAGKAVGEQEEKLLNLLFKPEEKVAIDLNKSGFANQLIEDAALKLERGESLSPRDAVGLRRAIDVAFPADTAKAQGLRARLANLRANAREVISREFPDFDKALKRSEATILRSQLSKPFRVNRTNPDQFSGLTGTILPIAGAVTGAKTGDIEPLILGALGSSPLAFGTAAATIGAIRNATNPLTRRATQRALVQLLIRKATEKNKPQ